MSRAPVGNVAVEVETYQVPSTDEVKLNVKVFRGRPLTVAETASVFRPGKEEVRTTLGHSEILVVLVHPWSKMGGCGQLMEGIARCLVCQGLAAITFDLRGVGKTNGKSTWTGLDEVADAEAVCNWAVGKPLEAKNILLAGSSAGACIAGSALERVEGVAAYVGIGYPFGNSASLFFRRHFENVLTSTKPKLFIVGSEDGFTSMKQFASVFAKAVAPKFQHVIKGVGHFELETPTYNGTVTSAIIKFVKQLEHLGAVSYWEGEVHREATPRSHRSVASKEATPRSGKEATPRSGKEATPRPLRERMSQESHRSTLGQPAAPPQQVTT